MGETELLFWSLWCGGSLLEDHRTASVAVYARCALKSTPASLFIGDVGIVQLQGDRPLVTVVHLSPNVCQTCAMKFVLHAFPTHHVKKLAMTRDFRA